MCAISCATMLATFWRVTAELSSGSTSSAFSRYVIAPQFSIAPAAKSGMAMWSSFSKRVRDAEVAVEVVKQLDAEVERELPLTLLPRSRPHADQGPAGRPLLDGPEIAYDERQQIGRHHRRVAERDAPQPAGQVRLRYGERVRDGREVRRHDEGEPELRLQRGLVPAWESPAGVRGLELRRGQMALRAVFVDVPAAVEPPQQVVQHAGELDVEPGRADGQRPVEAESHRLRLLVEGGV